MDRKDISYETIAITQDTGDPVMRATLGESKVEFIIDTGDKCINVWSIKSEEDGHMKMMLDDIVEDVGYDWIQFIAPLEDDGKEVANALGEDVGVGELYDLDKPHLEDEVEGFQKVTENHNNKEIPMLVGFWEVGE